GLAGTFLRIVIYGAVDVAAGGKANSSSPAFVQVATLIQDTVFVGAALVLAARTVRPRPWHFGLGRSRFWSTVGWMALAYVCFIVFEIVYGALVKPSGKQYIVRELGDKHSRVVLVPVAMLVLEVEP